LSSDPDPKTLFGNGGNKFVCEVGVVGGKNYASQVVFVGWLNISLPGSGYDANW
jgi:hypothetical protein